MDTVMQAMKGFAPSASSKGSSNCGGGIGEKRRFTYCKQPLNVETRINKRANLNNSQMLPLTEVELSTPSDSDTASVDSCSLSSESSNGSTNNNNNSMDCDGESLGAFEECPSAAFEREIAQQLKSVPSRSCYIANSLLSDRKKIDQGKRRSLEFGAETKTWCGLRPERMYLDELVHQFFVLGKQFSSVDVLQLIGVDSALVGGVNELLKDLCLRILAESNAAREACEEEDGVPVLLQGGGRGMKVNSFHHPYLVSLQQVVAEAKGVVSLGFSINEGEKRRR